MKEIKEVKETNVKAAKVEEPVVEEAVVEKKPVKKAATPKPEPFSAYAVTRVNLRKGKKFDSEVVRVIGRGEEILVKNTVEGEKGKWAVVDEGFVKLEYLKKVV